MSLKFVGCESHMQASRLYVASIYQLHKVRFFLFSVPMVQARQQQLKFLKAFELAMLVK